MQKTLIINHFIFTQLRLMWQTENSALTLTDYIVSKLSDGHLMDATLSPADKRKLNAKQFQIGATTQTNFINIETDEPWLLDAPAHDINRWLLNTLDTYTSTNLTTSPMIWCLSRLIKAHHGASSEKPAKWYQPAQWLAAYHDYLSNDRPLLDIEAMVAHCAKKRQNLRKVMCFGIIASIIWSLSLIGLACAYPDKLTPAEQAPYELMAALLTLAIIGIGAMIVKLVGSLLRLWPLSTKQLERRQQKRQKRNGYQLDRLTFYYLDQPKCFTLGHLKLLPAKTPGHRYDLAFEMVSRQAPFALTDLAPKK